jgi:hypothetical protein
MQVNDSAKTQQLFGIDVEQWSPAKSQVIDANVLGYPHDSLRDVPAGKYRVQVVLHRYETFQRNGRTIKLPMDRGEGQQWNRTRERVLKPMESHSIRSRMRRLSSRSIDHPRDRPTRTVRQA